MADVSGILAAGDIANDVAKAQQQPLQTLSTVQSILNAQEQNKLYQIQQQQQQLDLDKGQTSYLGGRLSTAAYLPVEAQTPEMYHQILDEASAMGPQNNPAFQQKIAYYRQLIDSSSPEQRKQIAMRAGMTFAPPEVQQRMATPDMFSVNQGNQVQFYNRPKAGMPGENVPAPVGSAVPVHMTESEGAEIKGVDNGDGTTSFYFKRQFAPDGSVLPGQQPINSGAVPQYGGNTNHSGAGLTPELQAMYQAAAKRTGVPVELLIAQGRQETTGFNTKAVGSAGEIGLGQVKPSTAASPGYGVQPVDPSKLTDPATNINFQADYLAGIAKKLGVDIKTPAGQAAVLRAYNGGGDPNYVGHVFQYMPKGGTAVATGGNNNPPPNPNQTASVKPMVPVQPEQPVTSNTTPTVQTADNSGTTGGGKAGITGAPISTTSTLTPKQLEADADNYHKVMADAGNTRQNVADLTEAYNLVKGLSSGKGLDYINQKRSLIASWGRRLGIDTGGIDSEDKAYDLANKILTRITMNAPGAGQSVFALGTAEHATPNLGGMNHEAALEAMRQMIGTVRQRQASAMNMDPSAQGRGFEQANSKHFNTTDRDGFASDLYTQKEILDRVQQLGGPDSARGKAFLKSVAMNKRLFNADVGTGLDK